MEVRLLDHNNIDYQNFQIYKTALAAAICTMNEENIGDIEKQKRLITRLVKDGHTSVLEHIVYTFEITDISRALLQELSRHRIASPTVQSTRWALKKFPLDKENLSNLIKVPEELYPEDREKYLSLVYGVLKFREYLSKKYTNDVAKYLTPECIYTKEILSINARSLINLFKLRTAPRALKEFKILALKIFTAIPESHKFIFLDSLDTEFKRKHNIG